MTPVTLRHVDEEGAHCMLRSTGCKACFQHAKALAETMKSAVGDLRRYLFEHSLHPRIKQRRQAECFQHCCVKPIKSESKCMRGSAKWTSDTFRRLVRAC